MTDGKKTTTRKLTFHSPTKVDEVAGLGIDYRISYAQADLRPNGTAARVSKALNDAISKSTK